MAGGWGQLKISIDIKNGDGDQFTGANGSDFVADGKAVVSNLPAGLTMRILRANDARITAELVGSARPPQAPWLLDGIEIKLLDSAFVSGDASTYANPVDSNVKIQFQEPPADIYVATTGSDAGGDGSQGNPYATILKAAQSANSLSTDNIHVAAGVYTMVNVGLPNKSVRIVGDSRDNTILQANEYSFKDAGFANHDARIIYFSSLSSGKGVILKNLTLRNGNIQGTTRGYGGGAIRIHDGNSGGDLVVENCRFYRNRTGTVAGAIYWWGGNFTLRDTIFEENESGRDGGAMWVSTSLNASNCVFRANRALGTIGPDSGDSYIDSYTVQGGGALGTLDSTYVADSYFVNNHSATNGGAVGIYVSSTFERCAFVNNTAEGNGGVFSTGHTGSSSQYYIVNSTVYGNHAKGNGGVFTQRSGASTARIYNSTIVGNSADGVGGAIWSAANYEVYSSIVAGNSSSDGSEFVLVDNYYGKLNGRNSILGSDKDTIFHNDFKKPASNNQWGTEGDELDPGVLPLTHNGGYKYTDGTRVPTVALVKGSPAIDAGANTWYNLLTDARGADYPRQIGEAVDIGSYEYGSGPAGGTIIYLR